MAELFPLFWLLPLLGIIGLVGALIMWAERRRAATRTDAVNRRVYLRPEQREAFLNVLRGVRDAPDRESALNNALDVVSSALWLPVSGPLDAVERLKVPQVPVVAGGTAATPPPTAPVPEPSAPAPALRWLAPDNITLLLYVGAALMVIAAGVFVASSWDAIGGIARFLIVAVFTLGFLVSGELFIRQTQRLRPAGETFRAVGTMLMPFSALAYDRFVLQGDSPVWYWAVVGAALAGFNYLFYRLTNPGRLTAYLGAVSLGVFAVALPPALRLDPAWTAASIWLLAGILFLIMARVAPDSSLLLSRLFRGGNSAIAESNLVVGSMLILVGLFFHGGMTSDAITCAAALILTAVMAGLSLYFRTGLLAVAAALVGGTAMISGLDWLFPDSYLARPAGLALYAVLLALIARPADRRLTYGEGFLLGVALFWAVMARSLVVDAATSSLATALTIAVYVAIPMWMAVRFSTPVTWGMMGIAANIAVIDVLALIPSETDSLLIPALLYLGVGALWLVLERTASGPDTRQYARGLFVLQAIVLTLAAYTLAALGGVGSDDRLALAVATTGLTAGWLWLTNRLRAPWTVAFTILEAVLAIPFVLLSVGAPSVVLPAAWLGASVALLALATILPAFAKQVTERGALILALVSPFGAAVARLLDFPAAASTQETLVSQIVLAGAALVYLLYGWRRRQRWAVGVSGGLSYVLYAWIINERGITEIQYYSVPLGALLFGYRWLFPDRAPLWEGLSALALIGVGMVQALVEEHWTYSAFLGLWGVLYLAAGITLSRRPLVVAGVAGILFAALRQLWKVVAALPPAMIIGVAGLLFLLVAIVLLLTRDRWLKGGENA